MTLGFGERETEFPAKVLKSLELEVCKKMGSNGDEIVDINFGLNFS